MSTKARWAIVAFAVYVGAIFMANWMLIHIGFIEVFPVPGRTPPPLGTPHPWWLLVAPAGVYMAGLSFPARDFVQRILGRPAGIAAIVVAAALTYLISPTLAFASGFTFLVSEGTDMTLYTWIQRKWFTAGVVISSVLAAVVDSLLFLYLAHIPYSLALAGQIAGKLEVILLVAAPVTVTLRRSMPVAVPA